MDQRRTFRPGLMALMLLAGWAAAAAADPQEAPAGFNIRIGPRERDGVLDALRRSTTFRDLFLAARSIDHLKVTIRSSPIRARAHFAHARPAPMEETAGYRVHGTARINVPASKAQFAARLGHELSHALSLVLEGCLDAVDCRPVSHETRARQVETRILREWHDASHHVSIDRARALLEGVDPLVPVVTARSGSPRLPVPIPARPGPFPVMWWSPPR